MDWRDFDRPHGFSVRYYDNTLAYKVHNVIPYKTTNPSYLVYNVMRSPDKVNVWLTDDDIVAQLDILGHNRYARFPKDYTAPQVVCAMLSQRGRLVIPDSDSFQPGLF